MRLLKLIDTLLTDMSPTAKWLRENCREETRYRGASMRETKVWVWNGEIPDEDGGLELYLEPLDGKVRVECSDGVVRIAGACYSTSYKRSDGYREAIAFMQGFLAGRGVKREHLG